MTEHIETLAFTIYGEARGETDAGKIAVAHVILNRFNKAKQNKNKAKQFGSTIKEVCLKKWQFSCWNPNDPNLDKILNVKESDPIFAQCLKLADKVVGGEFSDMTNGATHYHSIHVEFPKSWGEKKESCSRINNHLFYNNID